MTLKKPFHHALTVREDLCFGCTHCMIACPTEAIRVIRGKAQVLPERCVDCGNCMAVCPVQAIVVEQDDFNKIFRYPVRVVIFPSVMIGQFSEEITEQQIYSVLIEMGFTHIFEAEFGMDILKTVSGRYSSYAGLKPVISSFCPAVIRLIQVRFPSLVRHINQLKPPLDITAMYAKKRLADEGYREQEIGIFYVTPCAAKIAAIKSPVGEEKSLFDGVINMSFLYNLIHGSLIKQKKQKGCAIPPDRLLSSQAVLWSLTRGESCNFSGRSLAVDDIHNVIEFLEKLENGEISGVDFLELRACDEGCAGGILGSGNRFLAAERLRHRAAAMGNIPAGIQESILHISPYLQDNFKIDAIEPRSMLKLDDDMRTAVRKMELVRETLDNLPKTDCALCGAPNCAALAFDIAQGKADIGQCVFLQRRQEILDYKSVKKSLETVKKIWGREKIEG